MLSSQELAILFYNFALIPVVFFSVLFLMLVVVNLFVDKKKFYPELSSSTPFVTVQIPVYNDKVALRCLERCLEFDYPNYEIVIADDSTDKKLSNKLRRFVANPLVKYIHRDNRNGFKPGALQNSMSVSKGEIIVVFDSDWNPEKNFLRKIIQPLLVDNSIAIVQAKQSFENLDENLVTRFAGYLLMIYHTIVMPINNKFNTVFFCGTAGAIRRSVFDEIGGWNSNSITEDADLSIKILAGGYKTQYLNLAVKSQVPNTIEAFIKQQMRWCYGLTRAFFDNSKLVLFSKKLNAWQKGLITYCTLGNIMAPTVLLMTLAGLLGWFLGEPELFALNDLIEMVSKFIYTSGFMIVGSVALLKEKQMRHIPHLILGTFSISLLLITFNTVAFFKAVFNKPLFWYRTPKSHR